MELSVDSKARQLLERPPAQAILVTILTSYALPEEALVVERCQRREAEHDPTLVNIGSVAGTPVYAHQRVASYARWHPLRLTTQGLPWWPALAVAGRDQVLQELTRWERVHPGLRRLSDAPAI